MPISGRRRSKVKGVQFTIMVVGTFQTICVIKGSQWCWFHLRRRLWDRTHNLCEYVVWVRCPSAQGHRKTGRGSYWRGYQDKACWCRSVVLELQALLSEIYKYTFQSLRRMVFESHSPSLTPRDSETTSTTNMRSSVSLFCHKNYLLKFF